MSDDDYPWKAKERVEALIRSLERMAKASPEREVRGMAVPVLDAAIEEVKAALGAEDPIVRAIAGLISTDTIAAGEPVRAVDALLVAEQLDAAIGSRPVYFG